MNIEDYRNYCLSLGTVTGPSDSETENEKVEERFPFTRFKNGADVLVFYVCGHMFAFFDVGSFSVVSLKCQPERIDELKEHHSCIGNPYNESPRHWIGVDPATAPDALLRELTLNSYNLVKAKYRSHHPKDSKA